MKKNVFLTCAVFLASLIIAGAAQAALVQIWNTNLSVTSNSQAPFNLFGVEIDFYNGAAVGPLTLRGNDRDGYLGDTGQVATLPTTLTYVGGYAGGGTSSQAFTITYMLSAVDPNNQYGYMTGSIEVDYKATYDADMNTFTLTVDPVVTQNAKALNAYQGYDYVSSISVEELLGVTAPYTLDLSNAVVGAQVGELHSLVTMRAYTQRRPDPSAVPEPTTMVLFGAGLVGLAVVARKRKALKR